MGWDREEIYSLPVGNGWLKQRKNGTLTGGGNGKGKPPKERPWYWQGFAFRKGRRRRRHVITGGAGFIGSHLAEELLNRGDEVFVIDNLSTGSIENIEHLKSHQNFHYVIDTIANESVLAELIDRCDVVFHMAAAVGVKLIVDRPVHTIETNIYGTEAVLRHAAKKRKRVVIASTSEVYGKNCDVPFREDHGMMFGATTRRRWGYACSKAVDEFLALAYLREHQVPVTILRFFNTVGPGQLGTYGMVVPVFVRAALNGEPLPIHGDGLQRRCFSYVGDIVRATVRIALSPHTVGEVYNVGSEEEISIAELAERIVALCRSNSPIVHIPYEEVYGDGFEDMRRRVPDLSKVRQAIGYKPSYKLDQILKEIIEHEKKRISELEEPQAGCAPENGTGKAWKA